METTIDAKLQVMLELGVTEVYFEYSKEATKFRNDLDNWLDKLIGNASSSIIYRNEETYAQTYTVYGIKLTFK